MPFAVERRRAARVACRLPVRLVRGGRVSYAETQDLSFAGVRLRMSLPALDLAPGSELGAVARRIHERLGAAFVAEFGWPTLGSLVRRVLHVVRVAAVGGDPASVDLGCELRVPLETQETEALGLKFPALGEGSGLPSDAESRRSVFLARAVLMPPRAAGRAPVRAQTREVRPDGLVLTLSHPARLGLSQVSVDMMGLMLAFDDRFGHAPHVLLMGAEEPLWAGAARVASVEWQRSEDLLHVGLTLDQPLCGDELQRLGIG